MNIFLYEAAARSTPVTLIMAMYNVYIGNGVYFFCFLFFWFEFRRAFSTWIMMLSYIFRYCDIAYFCHNIFDRKENKNYSSDRDFALKILVLGYLRIKLKHQSLTHIRRCFMPLLAHAHAHIQTFMQFCLKTKTIFSHFIYEKRQTCSLMASCSN